MFQSGFRDMIDLDCFSLLLFFSLSTSAMETLESCVPPGFRFHPTEQELVGYYLKRKINSLKIDLDVIIDIDLYRMEPWDIQGTYVRKYVGSIYNRSIIINCC